MAASAATGDDPAAAPFCSSGTLGVVGVCSVDEVVTEDTIIEGLLARPSWGGFTLRNALIGGDCLVSDLMNGNFGDRAAGMRPATVKLVASESSTRFFQFSEDVLIFPSRSEMFPPSTSAGRLNGRGVLFFTGLSSDLATRMAFR